MSPPTVPTVVRGTDMHVAVAEDGTATVRVFDGETVLINPFGELNLKTGEAGEAEPGH
jgi:hypothetical protein